MKINILDRIFPFIYLSSEEKALLVKHSQLVKYKTSTLVCIEGEYANHFFIMFKGSVLVYIDNQLMGRIKAPSYFGELAVFFGQKRKATVKVEQPITCLLVKGALLKKLLDQNIHFCFAFATILRGKQGIFKHYTTFVNILFHKQSQGKFYISDLVPYYKNLLPVLHPYCNENIIDFTALNYVVPRCPTELTSSSMIVLAEFFPERYQQILNAIKSKPSVRKRQTFYEVLPGKLFVLLRDDVTDYIDFITKLCLYYIEAKKIAKSLLKKPSLIQALNKHYFAANTTAQQAEKILKALPFSATEMKHLKKLFGENLLRKLYEFVFQSYDVGLSFKSAHVRYYTDVAESWTREIKELLFSHFSPDVLEGELNIHIISSNTFSVTDCLSAWVHQNAKHIFEHNVKEDLEDPLNQLYATIRDLSQHQEHLNKARHAIEAKNGMYHMVNTCFTGIAVTVIDVTKLADEIDPFLKGFKKKANTILFNIDYSHGKQAETIMRNLILLFGRKIKSISVFGKAGSIVGKRGELLLPTYFLMQKDDVIHTIPNPDLTEENFQHLGTQLPVYKGAILTVLGPLMQNHEMLLFYKNFWHIIGLEMEGGYIVSEIKRGLKQNLLNHDIALRFAYYISDNPLDVNANLAKKLTMREGLPAVYTITRAILRKILM